MRRDRCLLEDTDVQAGRRIGSDAVGRKGIEGRICRSGNDVSVMDERSMRAVDRLHQLMGATDLSS